MVVFEKGGLYWHNVNGYVECYNKADDMAAFKVLRKKYGEQVPNFLAFDNDKDFEESTTEHLDQHINTSRTRVAYIKDDLDEERSYLDSLVRHTYKQKTSSEDEEQAIEKALGVWWCANGRPMDTEKGLKATVVVSDREFDKLNRKALRDLKVLNTDTGKITEYAEDGTVEAEYVSTPETSCDACERCTACVPEDFPHGAVAELKVASLPNVVSDSMETEQETLTRLRAQYWQKSGDED